MEINRLISLRSLSLFLSSLYDCNISTESYKCKHFQFAWTDLHQCLQQPGKCIILWFFFCHCAMFKHTSVDVWTISSFKTIQRRSTQQWKRLLWELKTFILERAYRRLQSVLSLKPSYHHSDSVQPSTGPITWELAASADQWTGGNSRVCAENCK